jgi:hypothetical protein
MKNVPKVTHNGPRRYAALRRSLARIGYISDGSVLDRTTLRRARTGYQWTRKVGRKTVTVALSAEQFKAMKKAVQNGRRLRKTLRAMEGLSRQILFAATPDTRRHKPFTIRDLRLI